MGQFDFVNGHMRLTTYHPGIDPHLIQKKTGFELEIAPNLTETPTPTSEEIHLLRNEIDPYGIRSLESLSGAPRRKLIREIIQMERRDKQ
jgi:hypothetical protein